MGFLDGLKNKISESGYADKVSAGLNTIGKGLQSGSEKIQSFASSLSDSNQHVIEDDVGIIDTQVPAIQENTSVLAESNVENNVSSINQREMFSVNENDSNETRQFKEIAQDLNTLANNETVRNFSIAVKESINLISEYNKREQIINAKLQMIDKQNQHSLDTMDKQYEQIKPLINELLAQIQTHRKNLETFDPKSMNEKDYNAYFMLSQQLDNCNSRIMQIYDKITG